MKYLGQIKIPGNSKPRNFHVAKTYCFKVSISYEEIKIKLTSFSDGNSGGCNTSHLPVMIHH